MRPYTYVCVCITTHTAFDEKLHFFQFPHRTKCTLAVSTVCHLMVAVNHNTMHINLVRSITKYFVNSINFSSLFFVQWLRLRTKYASWCAVLKISFVHFRKKSLLVLCPYSVRIHIHTYTDAHTVLSHTKEMTWRTDRIELWTRMRWKIVDECRWMALASNSIRAYAIASRLAPPLNYITFHYWRFSVTREREKLSKVRRQHFVYIWAEKRKSRRKTHSIKDTSLKINSAN